VLSTCAGAACRVDIGPDPFPLPKSAVRLKLKKKPGTGTQQLPVGTKQPGVN
jgi:hypothetical protein